MERQAVSKVQKMPTANNHPHTQSALSTSAGHTLLELQRAVGNQAIRRLTSSPLIQAKLQISTPEDESEQEADRVADSVMRMTEETIATKPLVQRVPLAVREDDEEEKIAAKLDTSVLPQEEEEEKVVATKLETDSVLQRQTSDDDEREEQTPQTAPPIQRQTEEEEKEKIQTKLLSSQLSPSPQIHSVHRSASAIIQRICTECEEETMRNQGQAGGMVHRKSASETPQVTTSAAANIQAMNGGGSPLPATTRAFFEPRFGADLSQVRVHTDSRAAETANTINARAFTVGQHIAFGTGRFSPHSTEGRQLLAHELTHVMQQSGAAQLSTDEVAWRSSPAPFVTAVQTHMVQRDKNKPSRKAKKPSFDLAGMETIKANAETRHDSITNFIRESRGTLQLYKARLLRAATLYKTAFSRHKAVLDKAKEAAEDRKDMISKIAGFVVGVALGVPGNIARIGLTALAQRAATAFRVGSELVELAVGAAAARAAGGPDADAFAPTAEIPELKELAVWKTIAEMSDKLLVISLLTAKQMKIVSAAGTAITEISLREGGAKNLKKTDEELLALVNALKSADETSGEVARGLQDAKAEIDELGAGPSRQMSVDEVEQDIWIEWIAKLTDDDLLDEDEITDHLEELNVIGEGRIYVDEDGGLYREPPRLDVDFGSWVSDEDERDAVKAARAKLGMHVPTSTGEYYYDED